MEDELQHVIFVLNQDQSMRTLTQLQYVSCKLEEWIPYIKKLKDQLQQDTLIKLVKSLTIENYKKFQPIFNQGETGRKMYFILQGEVAILVEQFEKFTNPFTKKYKMKTFDDLLAVRYTQFRQVAIKQQFEYFGEIAIEQRIPRTATVICKTHCICAVLSFESYQKLLRHITQEAIAIRSELIQHIYPFDLLSETNLQQLLHDYEDISLNGGSVIFKQHQNADSFYLIIEGEILLQKWEYQQNDEDEDDLQDFKQNFKYGKKIKKLINIGVFGRGKLIGDYETYANQINRCTQAITQSYTKLIKIWKAQFIEIITHTLGNKWLIDFFNQKYNKSYQQPLIILNRELRTQSQFSLLNGFQERKFSKVNNNQFQIIRSVEKVDKKEQTSRKKSVQLTALLKTQKHNNNNKLMNTQNQTSYFTMKLFAENLKQKLQKYTINNQLQSKKNINLQTLPTEPDYLSTYTSIQISPRSQKFQKNLPFQQQYEQNSIYIKNSNF